MHRILGLIKKELIHFYRDPIVGGLILYHFTICIVLCGYSFLLQADHLRLTVYDMDRSLLSRELIGRFLSTEFFDLDRYAGSMAEVGERLDRAEARAALIIPSDFSRSLMSGDAADVQYLADGSDGNQAGQGQGYATGIISKFNQQFTLEQLNREGHQVASLPGISNSVRPIFNQGMREIYFVVVSHILVAGVIGGLLLSSTAVVREKERGTIDQLLVTPTRSVELLLAKCIAPLLICLLATTSSFLVVAWFDVPCRGSVLVFFVFMTLFLISMIGIGILIGSVCNNMLQTVLLSFAVWFPGVFLAGVGTPVENMLPAVQNIANIMPSTHFMVAINGIFQKGQGFADLWPEGLKLLGTGALLFSIGARITWKQWKQ